MALAGRKGRARMAVEEAGRIDEGVVEVREGEYGERVAAVEPGGAEFIPLRERHGRPLQLFWTWTSPNLEFATIFVGAIAIAFFGLSFWAAVVALLVGTALGAVAQGALSARGPRAGVPQMVLSRVSFGYFGNALPAALQSVTAGIGWFAVNSVSGAFALNTLLGWPKPACLVLIVVVQVVIAFFGHNLVHAFERVAFPLLGATFLAATIYLLVSATPGRAHNTGGVGGFLLTVGAAYGYAAGWNPYATDYTRYLPARTSRVRVALWAGLGLFISCVVLEVAGAAAATLAHANFGGSSPTTSFTHPLPTALADATLLCIAVGAVAANVLNIYSGAMAFVTLGFRLPLALRRALVALVFGGVGFVVAYFALPNAGQKYENFLLVIAYWLAPWVAVFLTDQWLRRGEDTEPLLFDRSYHNWAGPIAMAVAAGVSIWLFANQTEYVGVVPAHHPAVGDLTFEVGFVLAAVLYALLFRLLRPRRGPALA
jgi:NCS1 family nucleobase:cation symporter-1